MIYCPNKNSSEYKKLVVSVGEQEALLLWVQYEGNVPKSFYIISEDTKLRNLSKEELLSNISNRIINTNTVDINKPITDIIDQISKQNPDLKDLLDIIKDKAVSKGLTIDKVDKISNGASAQYQGGKNLIKSTTNSTEDILHEIGHFITEKSWLANPHSSYWQEISKLYEYTLKHKPELADRYAFTNLEEFVSETLANSSIQRELLNTPIGSDYETIKPSIAKHLNILDRLFAMLSRLVYKYLNIKHDYNKENVYRALVDLTTKQFTTDDNAYRDIESTDKYRNLSEEEKALTDNLSQLDDISKLKEKAIQATRTKLQIELHSHGHKLTTDEINRREEFIDKLKGLEAEQALILYTKQASAVTNRFYKQYEIILQQLKDIDNGKSNIDRNKIFNPSILAKWRDYLSAYDVIDSYQALLTREGRFNTLPDNLGLVLNDTIRKKNALKDLYLTEGIKLNADFLSTNYDRFYVQFESDIKKKYSELSQDQKDKISEADFIRAKKEFEKINIHDQTSKYMIDELNRASKDVSIAGRYADTVMDSNDAPTAAAAKAMSIQSFKTESSDLDLRDTIVDSLRELEDFQGKTQSKKKLYDFAVELDSNQKPTGNIVNKFGGSFWSELKSIQDELSAKDLSKKEYGKELAKWKDENAPLDVRKFNKAKYDFLKDLIKDKKLTSEEYDQIIWNEQSKQYLSPHQLAEQDLLSEEAAELISEWVGDNVWEFREPIVKWKDKNPQWKELKRILDNPNDPRTKYYNMFLDTLEEHNNKLPYNKRLQQYQLPSIMKTTSEKIADGDSFKDIASDIMHKKFDILADDMDQPNQTIIDEQGNTRNLIPIRYTNSINKYVVLTKEGMPVQEFKTSSAANSFIAKDVNKDKEYRIQTIATPEEQSYDLSTVLFKFGHMATDYANKKEIFAEMELTRFLINNRQVTDTDRKGNPKKDKEGNIVVKDKNKNNLAQQFNDWYEMAMYGIKEKDQGSINVFGLNVDVNKAVTALNSFTSLNVLAVNIRAGLNNVVNGEAQQIGEAFAKQHMSLKSYSEANKVYTKNIPGMIEDIGSRKPINLVNQLYTRFHLPTESLDTNLKDATKGSMEAKRSALYFIMRAGDFYMQSRMFLGMLADKRAYNSKGEDIGSMLSKYSVNPETEELELSKDVDLIKSNWSEKEQNDFSYKTRGVMAGIHGEYGELERSAIQRMALGKLAIMFRKFIVPGIKRRYKKYGYNNRMRDYSEGYYRTFGRFFVTLSKELSTLQFTTAGEEWGKLSPMEKSNIIKTLSEATFLIAAIILASVFLGKAKDDKEHEFAYSWAAYQMLRFKSEILFFTPKIDETMSILRSPAASMSMFDNLTKTIHQTFVDGSGMIYGDGAQVYERGYWKGHYKMEKIMWDWVPAARSFTQLMDTKSQLNLMNQSMTKNK